MIVITDPISVSGSGDEHGQHSFPHSAQVNIII